MFVIRMSLRKNSFDKTTRYQYYNESLDMFDSQANQTVYDSLDKAESKLAYIKKYAMNINRIKIHKL